MVIYSQTKRFRLNYKPTLFHPANPLLVQVILVATPVQGRNHSCFGHPALPLLNQILVSRYLVINFVIIARLQSVHLGYSDSFAGLPFLVASAVLI